LGGRARGGKPYSPAEHATAAIGEILMAVIVSGLPGLSLIPGRAGCVGSEPFSRVGAGRAARARSRPGGAELHWLSLLLIAVGSAGDLRLGLAGSRGPERATGSIVAAAGVGA
jgi:hypothetical protein